MDHDITMNNVLSVLCNLIQGSKKNADILVEKGIHEHVAKVIFHFEGKAGWANYVQVDVGACQALTLLARYSSENHLAVLNTSAVARARQAFMAQPNNAGVQEWCRKLAE